MKVDNQLNPLKKKLQITCITLLFIFTLILFFGALNTMVSIKYEVEHASFFVEINEKLTKEQKQITIKKLSEKGDKLKTESYLFFTGGIITFLMATTILLKKKSS